MKHLASCRYDINRSVLWRSGISQLVILSCIMLFSSTIQQGLSLSCVPLPGSSRASLTILTARAFAGFLMEALHLTPELRT